MATCKGCGKEIVWGEYEAAQPTGPPKIVRVPLDPRAPVYAIFGPPCSDGTLMIGRTREAMVSHFATCPKASQFSGGKK